MEPNEMRRFTFSLNHGYEDDERGDLVFYEDAMQIITALQEKIDGMIKRPVVDCANEISGYQLAVWFAEAHPKMTVIEAEIMRCLATSDSIKEALRAILADPHGCTLCHSGKIINPDKGHQPYCPFVKATTALGMDDAKEGQEK